MSLKKFFMGIIGTAMAFAVIYFTGLAYTARDQAIAATQSSFSYSFSVDGSLQESGSMDKSTSPFWWLNSGGLFILKDGLGMTIQGDLNAANKWNIAYASANPVDTDIGYRPQNIFRLVTKSKWQNFDQRVYFKITKLNMSESPNRNASNGFLLFNRYIDGDNLYYTGVRVDGSVVIKKKKDGKYYTLAYKPFYRADAPYGRNTNINLIPGDKWIGVRSELENKSDGSVSIKLYMDKGGNGSWVLAAEAVDDGKNSGAVIREEGHAGIRSDFMDVQIDNYSIKNF